MFRDLLDKAPRKIKLRPADLQQYVSIVSSHATKKLVTLEEYLHDAQERRHDLNKGGKDRPLKFPRIEKMNREDVKLLVISRIKEQPDLTYHIVGHGSYNKEKLMGAVIHETELGRRLMEQELTLIKLLETLAEEGKIELVDKSMNMTLPEFDF